MKGVETTTDKTGPERKPYRRRSETEWAGIRALYERGATAKAAKRFCGTDRTIFKHLKKRGCLRKDQPTATCALEGAALDEAVREGV